MSRSRRSLLRTAVSLVAVALGGCTAPGTDASGSGSPTSTTRTSTATSAAPETPTSTPSPSATPSATATPTPTRTPSLADLPVAERDSVARSVPMLPTAGGDFGDFGDAARAFVVGGTEWVDDDHRPHQVWLWNGGDAPRTGTLVVTVPVGTVLRESVDVPPGDGVAVVFRRPAAYTVTFDAGEDGADDDDPLARVEVDPERFDCNDSATDVVVASDGTTERSTVSTELACR